MRKNILTIIIMAIVLINTVLTGVLIFAIVPSANRTNQLVTKVASIVDLELENPDAAKAEVSIADIVSYELPDKLTIPLKSTDSNPHYAVFYVSLAMNSKHADYATLNTKIAENKNAIEEIVQNAFSQYTADEVNVNSNKEKIKEQVLAGVQDLFKSDFIMKVSFGNIITD
ncbi:MAG TPA: flagellar basal body-associated FliL family protein [Mobilitalea sp.]|nr:flagellar basal body-associated FliL family protein [Mobilitalea sp.]